MIFIKANHFPLKCCKLMSDRFMLGVKSLDKKASGFSLGAEVQYSLAVICHFSFFPVV